MTRRIAFLLLFLSGCGQATLSLVAVPARSKTPPPNALRVLFIGNSLTASNDLPAIVQALAEAGRQRPLWCEPQVHIGGSLEDQWNAGVALQSLHSGKWDVVVLQQGPSSLPESRENLLEWAGKFDKVIREVGARPALYQVWPESTRPHAFDAVCESYRLAAKKVNGLLFPVGEAWQAAWRRDPKLKLYSDSLHPAPAGSYLAALVIYQQLFDASPFGLPARLQLKGDAGGIIELPADQARLLQEAAAEANEMERRRP